MIAADLSVHMSVILDSCIENYISLLYACFPYLLFHCFWVDSSLLHDSSYMKVCVRYVFLYTFWHTLFKSSF
jgi:hypothetical protein